MVKSEAVFETCIKGVRQWEGKSDDFPCFPGRGKPAASKSRSLDTSTVPTNCMKGTAQMLVLLGKHDLHKVLVRSRTCANGFQRTLRGRSGPLRGRSEGAQWRAESLRGRPGAALVLVWLFPRVEESLEMRRRVLGALAAHPDIAAARPLLLARKEERCVGARSRSTSVHSNNSLCSEIGRLANPPS